MRKFKCFSGLRFAISLLLAAAALAQAQHSFLPGDKGIGLAAGAQSAPALARGGDTVLVVWTDDRANTGNFYEYETSRDIYGMRFDSNGNQLDPTPIPIATFKAAQENPKVAWNGTNWLVAFETTCLGGTGYYYQKGMSAVRVDPNGNVLDPAPIQLYGLNASSGGQWDLASDGNNWAIVCQGTSASNGVVVMRVSASGTVLDPPNRLIVQPTYYGRYNFHLAFANGVFMVVFDDEYVNGQNTTSYVRFDSTLRLLDPVPVRILDHPASALSSNGTLFLLVSNRQMPDWSMRVNGNRVNSAGQKLDGEGVGISGAFQPQYPWGTFATWTGSLWRITWGNSNTLRIASVMASGSVPSPGGVPVSGAQSGPIAATSNGEVQTAWSFFNGNSSDVAGTHIFSNGSTTGNQDISIGAPAQLRSDSATNGDGYMVVYRSADSTGAKVMAQPLGASGAPLIQEPIVLASGPLNSGPTFPNVAWTNAGYMVTWGNGSAVFAQRLAPDGTKVDQSPFLVMNGYFGPADLAVSGDTVLVLGRKSFQNGEVIRVFGARVRASDATVLDQTPLLLGGWFVARAPAVVELGGKFLVAFHSNWTHDNPAADTLGVFVPTIGDPGATFGIHGGFSTSAGNGIFELSLASNGSVAMMVQSHRLSPPGTDLVCRFIDGNGNVSAYKNLTPWEGNQFRPRVSWDGRHFVVAYQEQKNCEATLGLNELDARSDLFGMRVAADGSVLDPRGFVFSASPLAETDPSVVSDNGKSLITGSLMDNGTELANYRIAYAFFGSTANQYPVAMATATPNGGDVPLTVSFSSAGSLDPDGTIVSMFWDFGDGTTSTLANPTHLYTGGVPVIVKLTVTDNAGAKTTQAILVWTTLTNKNPIAIGNAIPWFGLDPLDVVLYGDKSFDPDGPLGNFQWIFGDDQSEYWGSTAYHTFASRGIWPVDLTVWDSRQATNTSRLYVVVGPSAGFAPSQVSTTMGDLLSGTVADLGQSDDLYYTVRPSSAANRGAPAQVEATFSGVQANILGFALRIEASIVGNPQGIVQKVHVFNRQTSTWDLFDTRATVTDDVPYELALQTGGSSYVEAVTGAVKVRVSWTPANPFVGSRWSARIDHLRLTTLSP